MYASVMNEQDILNLIGNDSRMMETLHAAASMNLPQWMIGAGFVRNKVWDYVHEYPTNTRPTDIDLVYFDPNDVYDPKQIEQKLVLMMPGLDWEVVNQATAHPFNDEEPYASSIDAVSKWPETATAVAVTLRVGSLQLITPLGIEDLLNVVARATPAFMVSEEKRARVQERIRSKKWKEKWPNLQIVL